MFVEDNSPRIGKPQNFLPNVNPFWHLGSQDPLLFAPLRHGPPGLATIDGKNQVPFYQITKDGEKLIALPAELINRAREQEKKLQELDPERSLSNKIENTLCVLCEEPEDCGVYLTTRSMSKEGSGS